jgi:hypothetical protein
MAKIYGNRWLLKKSLNEGGQGVIFIVEDKTGKLAGEYALKRLKRGNRVARFRSEIGILRRLRRQEHHQASGCACSGRRYR